MCTYQSLTVFGLDFKILRLRACHWIQSWVKDILSMLPSDSSAWKQGTCHRTTRQKSTLTQRVDTHFIVFSVLMNFFFFFCIAEKNCNRGMVTHADWLFHLGFLLCVPYYTVSTNACVLWGVTIQSPFQLYGWCVFTVSFLSPHF